MRQLKKTTWLFGIAFTILAIFLPGYTKLQELRDRNRQLGERIKEINSENIALQEQLDRVQHDPVYQEQIAREKMGLVRKGEVLYKIEPEE